MIYNNLEFHNVDNLEKKEGFPGLFINRFPKTVQNSLGHNSHQRGRFYCKTSAGCEIRFSTTSPTIRISLSAWEKNGKVTIFCGNLFLSSHIIESGKITTIQIETPERFAKVEQKYLDDSGFSKNIYRICFDKNACFLFNDIETFGNPVYPPKEAEKPQKKWLAYGSSITMGGNAENYQNCYAALTARLLNVDIFNKSTAGSCFIDPEMSKYLLSLENWDFATLELGINMLSRFSTEEFYSRSKNLISEISKKGKPVFVISNFISYNARSLDSELKTKNEEFKKALEQIVKNENRKNLHFINGEQILPSLSYLTCDLLHPSDFGHIQMAQNLSNILKPLI